MNASDPSSSPLNAHTLGVQQLFVQHQQQLRAFVVALAPDFATADDAMQETFIEVSRKASEFQMDSNFQAWARRIAKFKVLSALRDRQRWKVTMAGMRLPPPSCGCAWISSHPRHANWSVCVTSLNTFPKRSRSCVRNRSMRSM